MITSREFGSAVVNGNLDGVRRGIHEGFDINSADRCGATPLMRAAFSRRTEVAAILLGAGADVHARNVNGNTALMLARDTGTSALLIQHGADVSLWDMRGRTALIQAAEWSDASHVQLLIDAGADIHARDQAGRTALIAAAENDREASVETLISGGAPVGFVEAALTGNQELVERLLSEQSLSQEELDLALWRTICTAHLEIIKTLLAHGADPNTRGPDSYTVLVRAIYSARRPHRERNIEALIAAGAEVNRIGGGTPLLACIHVSPSMRVRIVELLLRNGADPNVVVAYGQSAAEIAAEEHGLEEFVAPLRAHSSPPRNPPHPGRSL